MEKDTIGKLSSELLQKDTVSDHSAGEQMQEQLSEYEHNIFECVGRGKTDFAADFYVVVITKREKLMPNVLRHYFFPRISCPTPTWDQAVYKYTRLYDAIDFMWVIPDKDTCLFMRDNKAEIGLEQRQLLTFVLEFLDGTLDKKARVLNGEQPLPVEKVA